MIDAIQPRVQACVEEFLTTELPEVARVCLDRAVPALVDEQVCSAIPPLLEEQLPTLLRGPVATALATVDDESLSCTALKGAISSAVTDPLATTFPAEAGVDVCAQRYPTAPDFTQTHAEPIGTALRIGTMAPHPEGKSIYLPAFMALHHGTQNIVLQYSPIRLVIIWILPVRCWSVAERVSSVAVNYNTTSLSRGWRI